MLYCRHGHIEGPGNSLVDLSFHHQRKNLNLSIGQTEVVMKFARRLSVRESRSRRSPPIQNFRRNVQAAREHQLNGVEHDLTSCRLWDETHSPQAESTLDFFLIIRSRQNDDREGRVALA